MRFELTLTTWQAAVLTANTTPAYEFSDKRSACFLKSYSPKGGRRDLNPHPSGSQPDASSISATTTVVPVGLEPNISALKGQRTSLYSMEPYSFQRTFFQILHAGMLAISIIFLHHSMSSILTDFHGTFRPCRTIGLEPTTSAL